MGKIEIIRLPQFSYERNWSNYIILVLSQWCVNLSGNACAMCVCVDVFICVFIANEYFILIWTACDGWYFIWFRSLSPPPSLIRQTFFWMSQVLNYSAECFACDTINNGWSKLSKIVQAVAVAPTTSRKLKIKEEKKNRTALNLDWHVHYT